MMGGAGGPFKKDLKMHYEPPQPHPPEHEAPPEHELPELHDELHEQEEASLVSTVLTAAVLHPELLVSPDLSFLMKASSVDFSLIWVSKPGL